MKYEMDEMNFVLMHKEVVLQVSPKSNTHTSINMMKFNKVVTRHRAQINDQEQHEVPIPIPEASTSTASHMKAIPQNRKRKATDKSQAKNDKKSKIQQDEPDVVMSNMVDVAVQTEDYIEEPEIEEEFKRLYLLKMWQNYCVTTIKKEDFQNI